MEMVAQLLDQDVNGLYFLLAKHLNNGQQSVYTLGIHSHPFPHTNS